MLLGSKKLLRLRSSWLRSVRPYHLAPALAVHVCQIIFKRKQCILHAWTQFSMLKSKPELGVRRSNHWCVDAQPHLTTHSNVRLTEGVLPNGSGRDLQSRSLRPKSATGGKFTIPPAVGRCIYARKNFNLPSSRMFKDMAPVMPLVSVWWDVHSCPSSAQGPWWRCCPSSAVVLFYARRLHASGILELGTRYRMRICFPIIFSLKKGSRLYLVQLVKPPVKLWSCFDLTKNSIDLKVL